MRELAFVKQITRIEDATGLDPLVDKAEGLFGTLLKSRNLRDLLHGVPFGHPVHPVAVQIPIGAWTSAAILDLAPGTRTASRALIGVGVLSALPAIIAGWADWLSLHEQQKRVGVIHAAANATATTLYVASFIRRGNGKGKLLSFAALGVLSAAGFIGGHLAYRQAAGANHAEDVPHLFPEGWHPIGALDDLSDDSLDRRDVAGQPLLVLRQGDRVDVLSNTCSHLSGPLNEGTLVHSATGEACVACPWHDSIFELKSGDVIHGPATSPQPKFDTRVRDGIVEVMLPNAG